MKKSLLLTILVLFQLTGILFGQKIEVIKEKVGGSRPTKRVEFIDENNSVIKSIDLVEENPFNKLNYEIDIKDKAGHNYYKSIPFDEFFPDKAFFNSEKIKGIKAVYAYPIVDVDNTNNNFIIIFYRLATRFGDLYTGSKVTIRIYNMQGENIKEYNNRTDMGNVRLTENGKYLAYFAGDDMGDQGSGKEELNVKIINIENDKIILERYPISGFVLQGVYPLNDLFIIAMENYRSLIKRYEVINFEKRVIYSREFTRSEIEKLQNQTNEGFIFGIDIYGDSNTKTLRYENDFEEEDF
jgi:hypothetical protein